MDFLVISFVVDSTMSTIVAFVCLPQWSDSVHPTAAYCICILMIQEQRTIVMLIVAIILNNHGKVVF